MKLRIGLLSLLAATATMAAIAIPAVAFADGIVPVPCPSLPAATPTPRRDG